MVFASVLTQSGDFAATQSMPECFRDLNLDQVIDEMTAGREDYQLRPLYYTALTDADAIRFRQEVMQDLEQPAVLSRVEEFADRMRTTRRQLRQLNQSFYAAQQKAEFLATAQVYCLAVKELAVGLAAVDVRSRGLCAFRNDLIEYEQSPVFRALAADAQAAQQGLAAVRYCVQVKGDGVTVRGYADEPDYSLEIEQTFAKFRQGSVKDYRVKYSDWMEMSHVDALVVDQLEKLFPLSFEQLDQFWQNHQSFLDDGLAAFDREIQFYIACFRYLAGLRRQGLPFCFPDFAIEDKHVYAVEAFDLALAQQLTSRHQTIVTNDFELTGQERVLVVSGPNQGGKTTFARMFGQVHFLASLGCPVPGKQARVLLFDQVFTHFEREEHLQDQNGKLKDDLLRMRDILMRATSRSLLIVNEIFSSTALEDALYLGREILQRVSRLDAICVLVTFMDELSRQSERTVSMVSTVDPQDPARRTFQVVRKPADGLAYALSIAQKYGLTYAQLKERLSS